MLYNKDFGKLNNNELEYAPLNGKVGNTWYAPLGEVQLRTLGYKYIENTPCPTDGKNYVKGWKELKNKIKVTWTLSTDEPLTPPQQRELAYETELICNWGNGVYTVDYMNSLWTKYSAEGAIETVEEIQSIISTAKQEIRERYPDR